MACILKQECNFLHRYFRFLLPIENVDVEVKVKMMRGIHTFRRQNHPGHNMQPLEHKAPSLSILDKKNENILRVRRQAWPSTLIATMHQYSFP